MNDTHEGAGDEAPDSAAAVPSPCIDVCRIDATTGLCTGCLRTLDEIAAWSTLGDAAKRAVWTQLPARAARATGGDIACDA